MNRGRALFIVLFKGLVAAAQNWTLERSWGRHKARHITVTHMCGDHTWSCLTWLLRASALALCHPSPYYTNSGAPPIFPLYQQRCTTHLPTVPTVVYWQWCATHLPTIPTAVHHSSSHCTNSSAPPISPLYQQQCTTHRPTIPTVVYHPPSHYTNSGVPPIFPLYQQWCTTHLPIIPTAVHYPSPNNNNWWTVDTEITVPSAESPELSTVLPLKSVSVYASPRPRITPACLPFCLSCLS